jgi:hypothetical protein
MKDLWAHSYVDVYFIAMTYAGVGDKDQVQGTLKPNGLAGGGPIVVPAAFRPARQSPANRGFRYFQLHIS